MKSSSHRDISFTPPMECLPVANLPDGPGWVYELKLDGYRGQAFRDHRGVHLLSRRGKDFSRKFARVFDAMKDSIPIGAAVDRELVAFEETGQLSFNALQNADADTNVVFFAFDILMHNWRDTKHLPLGERKALLAKAIRPSDRVQVSEHFGGPIGKFLKAVREMGGEGVVAKRLESHYEPGRRSGAWSKKRLNIGQEFVIGGFTPASNGVDALVGWLLRGSQADVCRTGAFGIGSRNAARFVCAHAVADQSGLSFRKSSRSEERSVGTGVDGCQDEAVYLGTA